MEHDTHKKTQSGRKEIAGANAKTRPRKMGAMAKYTWTDYCLDAHEYKDSLVHVVIEHAEDVQAHQVQNGTRDMAAELGVQVCAGKAGGGRAVQ